MHPNRKDKAIALPYKEKETLLETTVSMLLQDLMCLRMVAGFLSIYRIPMNVDFSAFWKSEKFKRQSWLLGFAIFSLFTGRFWERDKSPCSIYTGIGMRKSFFCNPKSQIPNEMFPSPQSIRNSRRCSLSPSCLVLFNFLCSVDLFREGRLRGRELMSLIICFLIAV